MSSIGIELSYLEDSVGINWIANDGNADPLDMMETEFAKIFVFDWLNRNYHAASFSIKYGNRFWKVTFESREQLMIFKLYWGTEHTWQFNTY